MVRLIGLLLLSGISFQALWAQENDALLAARFLQEKEYDKAAELYERVYRRSGGEVYFEPYLESLTGLKDWNTALKLIDRQQKHDPQNPVLEAYRAGILERSGEAKKAQKAREQALKGLEAEPRFSMPLARVFLEQDRTALAIECLLMGRKSSGDPILYARDLMRLYARNGELQKAVTEGMHWLSRQPGQIEDIQNALLALAGEEALYEELRSGILDAIQRDPNFSPYTEMLVWAYLLQGDAVGALTQAKALDKRQRENGSRVNLIGTRFMEAGYLDAARQAWEYVVGLGPSSPWFFDARMGLLQVRSRLALDGRLAPAQMEVLLRDMDAFFMEYGRNARTADFYLDRCRILGFGMGRPVEAIDQLTEFMSGTFISGNQQGRARILLADLYVVSGDIWEAALLYGQIEKDHKEGSIGREAKFRNARLSYFRGDFAFARARLNVLKSSTSQLIANDALNLSLLIADNTGLDSTTDAMALYARADMELFCQRPLQALKILDTLNNTFPGHSLQDDILFLEARIQRNLGQDSLAFTLLEEVNQRFGNDIWADDALWLRSNWLYQEGAAEKGRELLEKLLTDYPGSILAGRARRKLAGQQVLEWQENNSYY